MLRYGSDRPLAAGVIAASGTLAQIIPPSLVLIVMAAQLGRSVGDMYQGAFIPGLMLAGLYAAYVFGMTVAQPKSAPALPPDALNLREPDGRAVEPDRPYPLRLGEHDLDDAQHLREHQPGGHALHDSRGDEGERVRRCAAHGRGDGESRHAQQEHTAGGECRYHRAVR